MINDKISVCSVEKKINSKKDAFINKIISKIKDHINDNQLKDEFLLPIYNEIYKCILPHYIIFITLFFIILILLIFLIIINLNLITNKEK